MNKMTNEEINSALAKHQGWDYDDPYWRKGGAYFPFSPNYCQDLNETHRAWRSLTHNQKKQFEIELYRIIIGDGDYNRNDDAMLITNATALQRAKALMKTLNLE